ncbi:MAG: glycosyltransferase family 39 protein [Cryobacterium sp.]|uniref:glycosyltransferase family 39 protein n=1 Tax=unclassified Cryobacterium TaxID=2649013 RepID=UPI0018CB5B6F|nr:MULTISPECIES: glycosyltransferase family 39 protein [unclassified Cryobacterium]MCY7403519.1 glycosyltransferase family 39 protein [Cryobacterium sp.]MEC5154789.1 putative membrane protein [Cryobacterium sp. CAN_C3]
MTSVIAPHLVAPPVLRGRRFRNLLTGRSAWLVALVAFLVSFAWSWQPSYWGDEAASIMSAERSLPSLFGMLDDVDAVHGLYYLFLHGWIDLFGASELSTRLPSAIAIGVAAAGTVVLARFFMGARVAIGGGLVFAILPRVTYMGAEARSTAIATAIGVWLTILLVHAVRSSSSRRRRQVLLWGGYSILLALGIYVFLFLALLLPVHAVVVLAAGRRHPIWRIWAIWLAASVLGLLLAAPIFLAGSAQREQIAFIGRRPTVTVNEAAVMQWFDTIPVAITAWSLITVAVIAVFLRRPGARRSAGLPGPAGLTIFLAWLVLPSSILLVGTQLVTPMYSLRYLSLCAPAVGIVIAVGVAALANHWLRAATVVALVAVIVPAYAVQRGDYGKNEGSDWRQVADIIAARAAPGDGVVFDKSVRPSRLPRLAMHVYPDAFLGLQDVTLTRSYADTGWLWDEVAPLTAVLPTLTGLDRIWLLQYSGSGDSRRETDVHTLARQGFHVDQTTLVNRTRIIEMTR